MATISNGRGWASDACVASIHRMDSAFGRILPITSAGRTYQEQADAYYRYRYQGGPLALPPGTSIHEVGNAIDWGSAVWGLLGLNSGLGWRGVPANKNGHRRTVSSEVWHTEYDPSRDEYAGGGAGAPSILAVQKWLNANRGAGLAEDGQDGPKTQAAVAAYQGVLGVTQDGVWGPATEAAHQAYWSQGYAAYGGAPWIKAIQNKLNRLGYGPLDEDGQDGPNTQAAVRKFQSDKGLQVDGIAGPITNNKMDDLLTAAPVGGNNTSRSTYDIQKKLISLGYDLGSYGADGDYGAATTTAVMKFQKDKGLVPDGVYGPLTDAALFATAPVEPPATQYPTTGYNATTRLTEDIQRLVGLTGSNVDGAYGPMTSQAVAKWQDANKSKAKPPLDVDGIWGPASDLIGFPGVALPDAPADPTADPLYGKKVPVYPGAQWADVSPNKSVRTGKIQLFIIHHRADTNGAPWARKRFMTANDRNVSPNYNVNQDGGVDEIVPPDAYRAWTTGAIDHFAMTAETGNTSGEPTWGISEQSHEALAQLAAWGYFKYGIPLQRGSTKLDANGKPVVVTPGILGHRDVAGQSTACPGPSMNIDAIIVRAKEIYQEKYVEVPVGGETVTVDREWLKNLQAELATSAQEVASKLA